MPTPEEIGPRVLVVGCSGAGKSTFAKKLAERLGCERVELDAVHWGPDWTPGPWPTSAANWPRASSRDAG